MLLRPAVSAEQGLKSLSGDRLVRVVREACELVVDPRQATRFHGSLSAVAARPRLAPAVAIPLERYAI